MPKRTTTPLQDWRQHYRVVSNNIRIAKAMARNGHVWGQYKLVGPAQSQAAKLRVEARWWMEDARPIAQALTAAAWDLDKKLRETPAPRELPNAITPDERLN